MSTQTAVDFFIELAGDSALIVYVGDGGSCSAEVAEKVAAITAMVEAAMPDVLIDLVPSYASVLIIYNAALITAAECQKKIQCCVQQTLKSKKQVVTDNSTLATIIILPVYYSLESGPDLSRLADGAGLSIEQFINIHQQTEYRVYAIGFAPGFAYMGELDSRLATPRLSTPRAVVPKGAVAIADRQTAVYPAESPGGWNLIGLCPVDFFNPDRIPAMPVKVGDTVQFQAISRQQYLEQGGKL